MGRFFETPFKDGSTVSRKGFAQGIRRLAEAFERMEIVGGFITWDKAINIPTLHVGNIGTAEGFILPKTFQLTQDGAGTITLIRCHYQRGSNFIVTTTEPTCSIETGVLYAVVNTQTGEITAQINFTNDPAQPELMAFALYKITAGVDSKTCTVDYETGVRVLIAYE